MEQPSFWFYIRLIFTLLTLRFSTLEIYGDRPWRNIGNYTLLEKNAIDKFRTMMGPELYLELMRTDQYLIRWIRDQKFNLPNAKAKLLRSLKWRKENKIDGIVEEDYSRIFKLCPYDTSGRDKEGRPVVITNIANCRFQKLMLSGDLHTLKRAFYQRNEDLLALIHTAQQDEGSNVTDVISITNGHGFNMREFGCIKCLPLMTDITTLYEENYPECLFRSFSVNMPRITETLLTLIQPFLSEKTKSVYKVYGYNKKQWSTELLKLISEDQLTMQFGGTKSLTNGTTYATRIKNQMKSLSSEQA